MTIIKAEQIMLNEPAHARKAHDERFAMGSAFMNGSYCGLHEAGVPIVDMGFMHADAAYDVVSVSKGQFFRLEDHLERFEKSCEKFLLINPYSREQTADILTNLVKLAGTQEAYVWWCVTRGMMPADRADLESYQPAFYAFVIPYLYIANDEQRTRGLDVMISKNYIRIPPSSVDPTAKNLHWMDMKLSMIEAVMGQKDWSVLTDADGNLAEAPGANIFLIKDGELYTPDSGCLEGITRKTTLELAREAGIPIHVEPVITSQLLEADEAFITSTAGGIMPINSVDGVVLGDTDGPGEITTALHNRYWEKRWGGWLATTVDYDTSVNL
ncbi:branched-chain amino acid--2-keto-4-methylthiobutyrate aminotransferase [Motiliproteus coralliicola]|uniref:Aminodeoxychorismate lyase n=1 Tax=Motiliproteus coralliicola TaxID=2283196 RepID=A0A369WRE1_9GAMM|nr:aminotransferase class IV [Motiliproteus coralliicola]RDE24660.1 branched-chain amino acid--2-keto-4-methylthiobutyrate aminotransferase [Motiliproteus coralliicola]